MRRRSILQMVLIGAAVGALVGVVAYLVPWLPEPASKQARPIDDIYWFVTIICIVIFALVAAVTIYAVWKFRAQDDDDFDGSPIHGHTGLEIVWTAIPAILVTAISVYSGIVLTQIEEIPAKHRVVEVTAQQFAWSFSYPAEKLTSGQLVLPVGEPVELSLAAKDVIHSFWVPQWRMKRDAVPGIITTLVITPDREGTYPIVCAELCGLGHATMRATARVVSAEGFERWLKEQRKSARRGGSGQGKELFATLGCSGCHTLAAAGSSSQVGPNLDQVLAGADAVFVRESIIDPEKTIAEGYMSGVMPQNFDELLSDAQLDGLVQYLLEATKG